MSRSQKLGHCICNPKHPCPCPTFLNQNICPCAGERQSIKPESVSLTRHVRKAGCASKIGQADLLQILQGLPENNDPRILVGRAAGDDAGVFQIGAEQALVQTVDLFSPCVDDPFQFGQIAAANSLSDVYAMGGKPITALSIIGFPIEELDGSIMRTILQGGIEKLVEADCALLGGHSINDQEIKCGFAITGLIHPDQSVERDRAQQGDLLVLTKPLGTGVISFAAQLGLIPPEILEELAVWMARLNKDAAELMVQCDAHACTDITGFGLTGHLLSMARGSGVDLEIDLSATPVFAMVPECLKQDVFGGAVDRNQSFALPFVQCEAPQNESDLPILFDPQTSGGLLISLPGPRAVRLVEEMQALGHTATAIVGRVLPRRKGEKEPLIRIINPRVENLIGKKMPLLSRQTPSDNHFSNSQEPSVAACCESPPSLDCCDHPPTFSSANDAKENRSMNSPQGDPAPTQETLGIFREFMKEANSPGRIDGKNKKLMAILLSIAHHCHPCLKAHLEGAIQMGIEQEEIDEAANLAIAFGGCTAMMFYREVLQEVRG